MQVHLWHRNVWDNVVILEVGNPPHPRCPLCDMLVPWRLLNRIRHRAKCKKGAEQKRRRLVAEEERVVTSRAFSTYGISLDMVTSFQYLGRVILAVDDDCPVDVRKLSRAGAVWKRMTRIISREGADPHVSGFFLKAVVQAVLLFGAET